MKLFFSLIFSLEKKTKLLYAFFSYISSCLLDMKPLSLVTQFSIHFASVNNKSKVEHNN